ncbi:MAG: Uma2 family endonuclease [Cyanobacteria bacterium P01_A01_bin.123]
MVSSQPISPSLTIQSLDDWIKNPLPGTEWVDGKLVQKHPDVLIEGESTSDNGMTLKHSRVQSKLAYYWRMHVETLAQDKGEVYTEAPCRTQEQGRSPDVAYLTPDLVAQYGDADVLPQSFPLIAEIVSPTDFAESIIAKAYEYLASGAEEVWLVLPNNNWVIVVTHPQQQIFTLEDIVQTQTVLPGFNIAVRDLLS